MKDNLNYCGKCGSKLDKQGRCIARCNRYPDGLDAAEIEIRKKAENYTAASIILVLASLPVFCIVLFFGGTFYDDGWTFTSILTSVVSAILLLAGIVCIIKARVMYPKGKFSLVTMIVMGILIAFSFMITYSCISFCRSIIDSCGNFPD